MESGGNRSASISLCVHPRMLAATLASSSGVSFRRDAHLATFDHDHHLVDESAVAARELEDLAGLHRPSFAVFALGVSAHGSLSIGSHTIMQR